MLFFDARTWTTAWAPRTRYSPRVGMGGRVVPPVGAGGGGDDVEGEEGEGVGVGVGEGEAMIFSVDK